MARKKKMSFKLNPEWMLKEPLDFEYNKYNSCVSPGAKFEFEIDVMDM